MRIHGPWQTLSERIFWRQEVGTNRRFIHKVIKDPFEDSWFWMLIREDGHILQGHCQTKDEGVEIVDRKAKELGYRLLGERFSIFQ
jgi:hypothetical protein